MKPLTETVRCRWCEHTTTGPGWGAALTRLLLGHVADAHPGRHLDEPIEARR